jgi:pyruvate/2-oxoglutarate dehydrogenase complex dihydrolipoamide dehydrogenase (E3) component
MFTPKYRKPISYDYDLIVIGSGAGGGVAAQLAASEGKKVAIVEAENVGGTCPHDSCVPTKALLKAAETLEVVKSADAFGIKSTAASFNYRSVQAWKESAIKATGVTHDAHTFSSQNITVIKGHGHFITPWTISVGLRRYSAHQFLLATGSTVYIPAIEGLADTGFITYKEASRLEKIPKSLFIIGGGATAYEYAQIFVAFGTKVHVIESAMHLLPKTDVEVGDIAEAALTNRGVRVHTAAHVRLVSGKAGHKIITFEQHGQQHKIVVEEIMVASGKRPNVDIGLENAGVRYTDEGIYVTKHMQTNKSHIFAAGDVIGHHLSTHVAMQEARIAVHNMYHRKQAAMDYMALPQVYFGQPEIATVGKTERELKMTGDIYQTAIAPISILGRSITSNYTSGFVKITATQSGIVLGASIVAPDASEMIGELTLAVAKRLRACDISNTVHAFPTWSEAIRVAAANIKCI